MALSFSEFLDLHEYKAQTGDNLQEKLILYNNGAKYGQVVFLAGGAGSGKGFAISNFMRGTDFKIRDVDEMKLAFQKLDELQKFTMTDLLDKYGSKIKPEDMKMIQSEVIDKGLSLKNLQLKNPIHVYILHVLVAATGAKQKTLELILSGAERGALPNILFDTTFRDLGDVEEFVPMLLRVGYQPKDIHITWVLTNYEIAIKNNASRARVVPQDIMLKTHSGAAQTILSLAQSGMPDNVDGAFYVILNNPENTIFAIDPKTGEHYKNSKGGKTVQSFTYLTLKKSGKPIVNDANVKQQLYDWVISNVPKEVIAKLAMDKL